MDIVNTKMIKEIDEIEKDESNRPTSDYNKTKSVDEIREIFSLYIGNKIKIPDDTSTIEEQAIYFDILIQLGEKEKIYEYSSNFNEETLKQIFNVKPNSMYYGTVLHSTLYANTGEIAKDLYIFFRENGAIPYLDYYGNYPWEQNGIIWSSIPYDTYYRNNSEFSEIYNWVFNYEQTIMLEKLATNPPRHITHFETYSDDDYD